MKKIFYLLLLSVITFYSCSDTSQNSEVFNNTALEIFGRSYDFYNYNNFNYDLTYTSSDKSINSHILTVKNEFSSIVQSLNKTYNLGLDSTQVWAVTFYGKGINQKIDKNITGLSVLEYSEGGFYQRMYNIDQEIVNPVTDFTRSYIGPVFIESFGYFGYESNDQINSLLVVFRGGEIEDSSEFLSKQNEVEEVDYDFHMAILEQYPIIFTEKYYIPHYCSVADCDSSNNGFCGIYSGEPDVSCKKSSYIDDCCCAKSYADSNLPIDPTISAFGVDMYDIRDNVLSLSSRGSDYKDFYEKIGYVLRVTQEFDNNPQRTQDVIEFLLQKSHSFTQALSNNVVITSSDSAYILSIISSYRNLTTNHEFQRILNTIEADVTYLTNKKKSEIITYFM
ncbi:hypothetical protein NBRC110019_25250 [Neptunitalea chrysea]|uniref:Uncharacterized protein n=1 Tax=Neptunitalea chrysea TaxID=1647581 RepID=A0A9W6B6B6_9FLAO|nr:hypothetical protein [Neptunitalea chrysea]GLB53484.1 hypothetical protein NBRC110019_25250 [Neptunitalea chrysea]